MKKHSDIITQIEALDIDLLSFIEAFPGYIYWKNSKSQYIGCNQSLATFSDLTSPDDIIGKEDKDFGWGKTQCESFRIDDLVVINTGKHHIAEYNLAIQKNSLENIWIRTEKTPLKNKMGETVGIIGVALNITELKQAKEKAEAANEAKEAFLRNMRHDLRTPFSGMLTLSEWMATQETDPSKKENLECIAQSAQVLLDYMNTVLEQARKGEQALAVENTPFDLEKLIKEAILTIKPVTINKGLSLILNYPETIPKAVCGDAARLQRVMMNLLGNAVKFTHQGEIRIDVSLVKQKAEKVTLAISVSDTGIGIPLEKREAIFEKFTRLEAAYEGNYSGMGLGLHDVKDLCEQLSGEISVTHNGQQGSIFTCTLPFELSMTTIVVSEKATIKNSASTSTTRLHILLIEDQPIAAHAASTILRSQGYEVDIAPTGQIALEKFTDQFYDLVLLDIGLPDTNGTILARQFRKLQAANKQAPTPLIALTAHERLDSNDIKVFDGILNKPFSILGLNKIQILLKDLRHSL